MRKSIKVNTEISRKLLEMFGVSHQYIWNSLNYVKNGPSAIRIRKAALDMGGVYVKKDFIPNCLTSFTPEKVIQEFAGDVVITIDRRTGNLSLTASGEELESIEHVDIDGWSAMAEKAQTMARTRIQNS